MVVTPLPSSPIKGGLSGEVEEGLWDHVPFRVPSRRAYDPVPTLTLPLQHDLPRIWREYWANTEKVRPVPEAVAAALASAKRNKRRHQQGVIHTIDVNTLLTTLRKLVGHVRQVVLQERDSLDDTGVDVKTAIDIIYRLVT